MTTSQWSVFVLWMCLCECVCMCVCGSGCVLYSHACSTQTIQTCSHTSFSSYQYMWIFMCASVNLQRWSWKVYVSADIWSLWNLTLCVCVCVCWTGKDREMVAAGKRPVWQTQWMFGFTCNVTGREMEESLHHSWLMRGSKQEGQVEEGGKRSWKEAWEKERKLSLGNRPPLNTLWNRIPVLWFMSLQLSIHKA